jgi:hypothetical protein
VRREGDGERGSGICSGKGVSQFVAIVVRGEEVGECVKGDW